MQDKNVAGRVMSKTSSAPEAPRKYERVIDLYVSCPAVSHRDSFIFFCSDTATAAGFLGGSGRLGMPDDSCVDPSASRGDDVEGDSSRSAGLLDSMRRRVDAGGPTGKTHDPNSTPMVTSCVGEKRPSQSRIVNYDISQT